MNDIDYPTQHREWLMHLHETQGWPHPDDYKHIRSANVLKLEGLLENIFPTMKVTDLCEDAAEAVELILKDLTLISLDQAAELKEWYAL